MLDQTFTAENFRRIYDSENRKGQDLAGKFFPTLKPHTLAIRTKIADVREFRLKKSAIGVAEYEAGLLQLKTDLAKLKSEKASAIDSLMEAVSAKVLKTTTAISLSEKVGPKGKAVFCIDDTPETFFIVKQLQRNINRIYKVKQSNRHDLVSQFRDTVSTKFPLEVVRTDISSFYETVDRKKILEKLDQDQLLSTSSKKYIKQILDSYGALSGSAVGIPRGVGVSAYLAELSLREIDKQIKNLPGVVLYCRFVDDIAAVFARPITGASLGSYKNRILDIIQSQGLTHNPAKTDEFALGVPGPTQCEYLGYKFAMEAGKCSISPSATKVAKYEARLNKAFAEYDKAYVINYRLAYRDLVARVKFLTGNTKLLNSKSGAVTGIYYNNSIVTDLASLKALDVILKAKVAAIKRPKLRERLKPFTFTNGFEQRRFHCFSTRELHRIVGAWKHD